MKLFKRNQSLKKPEENYDKILNESELEPYSYTPTLDADDIDLGDGNNEKGNRYINNFANDSQQSFTVITENSKDDSQSTITQKKSF